MIPFTVIHHTFDSIYGETTRTNSRPFSKYGEPRKMETSRENRLVTIMLFPRIERGR